MHALRLLIPVLLVSRIAGFAPASAETVLAARGTHLYAVAQERVTSKTAHDGDPIVLSLKNGFFHKNPQDLQGAVIEGHLQDVEPASPTHKAKMSVIFDDVKLPSGNVVPIAARLESAKVVEPHTHHIRDAGLIIGGAIGGHMLGKSRGIKHGGLAGAAGGFALASSLKSDVVVKRGTQFNLKLTSDLSGS